VLSAEDTMGVGARMRARRTALGLRLVDVAEHVGISASAVSQMERGLVRPSMRSLVRVAEALRMQPHHLLETSWADDRSSPDADTDAAEGDPDRRMDPGASVDEAIITRASKKPFIDGGDGEQGYRVIADANPSFAAYEFLGRAFVSTEFFTLPSDHLSIVLDGIYRLEVRDAAPVDLEAGDTVVLKGGVPFRWSALGSSNRLIGVLLAPGGTRDPGTPESVLPFVRER
jgi:transcriptional regulator with XRE-family HTH domain